MTTDQLNLTTALPPQPATAPASPASPGMMPAMMPAPSVAAPAGQESPIQAPNPAAAASQAPLPTGPMSGLAPAGNQPGALPKISEVAPQSRPWLVIFAVVAAFIAIIGCFILYFLNVTTKAEIDQTGQKIESLTAEIAGPPLSEAEKVATAIKAALSGYEQAVNQQIDFPAISEQFLATTPKDMKLQSWTLDDKGALHLSATFPDFLSAGKALLAYRQAPFLTNVKMDSIGLNDKAGKKSIDVSMSATVAVDKFLLNKKSSAPSPEATIEATNQTELSTEPSTEPSAESSTESANQSVPTR